MIQDHTIISIDGHQLVIVLAPEVEDDRGFIKFFRKELVKGLTEKDILQHTALHGNGISLKMAKETISENNYVAPFKVLTPADVDLEAKALLDTRSFFNDMEGHYSAVFFSYKPKGASSERVEYGVTVVDFRLNSNPMDALEHSLSTIGGLKVTPIVGELY